MDMYREMGQLKKRFNGTLLLNSKKDEEFEAQERDFRYQNGRFYEPFENQTARSKFSRTYT